MSSNILIAQDYKPIPQKEDAYIPYKIYVGFEKNANKEITSLEIIDGYLKKQEQLFFHSEKRIDAFTTYYKLEIIKSPSINTYLKIPISMPIAEKILVKVFNGVKAIGFQWIDKEGNVLGPIPTCLQLHC